MRGLRFAYLGFTAVVATFGATTGCNGSSDDCGTLLKCPVAGSAGSSGDAGAGDSNAGTSGTSGGKGGAGSSGSSSDGKSGTSGTSGTSAAGDGGAAGTGSGSCDTTKSPTEEACLIADDYAVFVAPNGNDNDDGSQATPFASLTKAIEVAAGAKLVLVCDATYNEHVVVGAGVHVYGGFKCTDWSAEIGKPLFKPTTAGPALKIDGVDDEVVIEGVSFEVGDAANPGETALTAIVNQSPKVTLRAVSLKAGKGKSGVNGTLSPFDFPARTELKGNSAIDTTGGLPKPYTCPGGAKTSGGVGGTASPSGQGGGDGSPLLGAGKGKGGTPGGDCATGLGGSGANAPDAPAASGAQAFGTLTPAGWTPGTGGDGQNGSPGQGGGGGASTQDGGGGGGGAGACGGAGAKGGQGGGGSIALAVLGSAIALEASELITQDAGNGGGSVAGQPSDKNNHPGGINGNGTPPACPGGVGGTGGDGAAGGGGAGGISVGIVWKGAKASTVSADTTITNGKAGTKGSGGVPNTNDGIAGVSQKILQLN